MHSIHIDTVWAGTRVGYDAIENQDYIYIAYYDAERWLTVAQYNKCTSRLEKVKLPSQFGGWDAHNYITLAFDDAGKLHIAGNMHASPLVYAYMQQPDQLQHLTILQAMTGQLESQVTYPKFFKFNDGKLGFMYRHGGSGNGVEMINRFENGQWQRWLDQPLFAPSDITQPVNAYHTGFKQSADGMFHIAWVWRSNKNVETNFNINYAKSHDLKTWFNSHGEKLELPMTPSSHTVVDEIAEKSGLYNSIRLGFDLNDQPIISYIKFDHQGLTQLYHAWTVNDGFEISQATTWDYRWDPRGGGTIVPKIYFSGVMQSESQLIEQVHHDEYGDYIFAYENQQLAFQKVLQVSNTAQNANTIDKAESTQIVNTLSASKQKTNDAFTKKTYEISWSSHTANNRDRPRQCETTVCQLTSQLTLTIKNRD